MITKEKILDILYKYAKDNFGINTTYIDNIEFEDLAEDLVKNCSIPDVVGRSEQYCEHAVTDQKTLRCTCCEECGEILDVLD